MTSISSIGRVDAARTEQSRARQHHSPIEPSPRRADDSVELSPHAKWMSRLRELPPARLERLTQIREAITAERYITPDKIEATIDALANDLLGKTAHSH